MFSLWILFLVIGKTVEDRLVPGILFLLFCTVGAFYLLPFRRYVIDATSQNLIVKSYFPERQTVIPFSEFDAIVSTKASRMRGGPVRVLCFQKDGKNLFRLTGDLYKNLEEVERQLTGVIKIKKS